jgi:1-acyl-sn-glycerol-3-phosphate acyltransferase
MVYHILKHLTRVSLLTFYRNVQIRGLHHMPKSGPIIICSNHTNAFLDALIVGAQVPRKIKSLPRGTIFFTSGPALRWLFNEVGMIPIFRAIEGKENLHRNEATFQRCYDVLAKGGAISVFPEGICIPERRIKAMKKGAARIVFGAEELNNFSLDTKIIFIGLNYEKAWRFKTNLFLNCSRPYGIDEFIELYKENKVKGINELTKFLRPKLTDYAIHIAKPEYDDFYEQVETLYARTLLEHHGLSWNNLEHRYLVSREIAKGINYHFDENPEGITAVQKASDAYFKDIYRLELDDKILCSLPGKSQLIMKILATILGFPLHLYGLINNYIPAKIAKTVADKVVKKIDFYSSVTIMVGIGSFLFFYPVMSFVFWLVTGSFVLTSIYLLTLYLSGNYSAFYIEDLRILRATIAHALFKKKNESKFNELLLKRESVVNKLVNLKETYRSRTAK